ncbi:MAG: leucine-rich repeat domain-containing protein [Trichocoleus desertorum ATA4-8-CV12]|jgi:internalin A|nr:leucine-rich repeat domain-containing protein [Trichocoleus desertorum ATA4-8-CV12]
MTREELLALIDQAAEEGWTELSLSNNQLTQIPEAIAQLTNLTTLDLSSNQLTQVPEAIAQLTNLTTLHLSSNQLTQVPEAIAQLTNLTTLHLSSNQLTQVPEAIAQLTNLTTLDLSNNQLTQVPEAIAQLTNLTTLDLSNNQLTQVPEAIAQLTNLTTLDLSYNQLTQVPEAIAQLTNLTTLDLSYNQLTQVPEAIAQLTSLTTLYLRNNQLTQVPEAIAQLTSLTTLYLRNNQLTQVPEAIAQLTSLTTLTLSSNQLTQVPEAIAQLTNLTTLDLSNNQLTQVPKAIAQLTSLTTLHLSRSQLTQVPAAIAQLTNLTTLTLSSNQLTQVPAAIAQLTNLTTLALFNNQLTQVPEAIAQLTNLTTLTLSSNQLTQVPEAIAQLTNLTKLDLSDNQLTQVPEAITQLTNLTKLDLSGNQLTQVPEAIAQLTNLTKLDLSGNQLTQVPEAIAQLTNLTKLHLYNNQITEIPSWLEELPNLNKLDLRQNPLPISPEILGPPDLHQDPGSVEAIFNYCRQLRSGEVRPLNEAKLLLIGQGSVGKTSLINRLLYNRFNRHESQTDGLNIETWNIHVNSKDVRLNVWDFGGQEIYHATHQFFLTKRSLYLLVCNCRTSEEENRIEYWLKLIESFGGQSPVIIVGNKKDEQPFDINRKALRDKYPNIKDIIETSCDTNEGINDLRSAITREVGQLNDVYNLLPLSWFEVKEQLESMDEDFISYGKYACICAAKTVTEETNQEQLIDLLHNLGLVLNFRDHPILQSTNVLNPDWVTEGIYALLSDEILKTKTKGILTYADLSRVLNSQRYPTNRHHYLIELMKEFQLCFQIHNCATDTFLIPGLLSKEEPKDTNLEGDTLEFQYHYRVLPESILSRFIVLTHDKIYSHTYWRSGVMLAYTEGSETYNIARIKADLEDKKIFISISGRETTRRSFLVMIRDVFNRIHGTFANPEATEWVPVPDYPNHPPLNYQELLGLEKMGIRDHPIGRLGIIVNLRQLLEGYEPIELRQKHEIDEKGSMGEKAYKNIFIINNNKAEARAMSEGSQYTNNNQGANIGNFVNEAKDSAQVTASNFSQTSGANTAELLQLITNMRQIAAQFPQEIQDDALVDIDDVEVEIKKPENQRNLTRLRKRLFALAAIGAMIATQIASGTDFANNAIDLGSKLGIELQLPPASKP